MATTANTHEREAAPVHKVLEALSVKYPEPRCELSHEDPYQLLVATQLSAQCTDARVNMVTPELFRRWPDAEALAGADQAEVEEVIHSTGFYRNKARNLVAAAKMLVERHGGEVPREMAALVALPGTARKTANVVLGTAFGIQEGLAVDTHVFRVTMRLGWHREKDPKKVEYVLMNLLPRDRWSATGHRLVLLGRYVCVARKPRCEECPLAGCCPEGMARLAGGA